VDINRAREAIRENTKISENGSQGYYKMKYNKPCSELLDQRKQEKLQWLQDQSEINGDNLNNKRRKFQE
jgi:hypothetical protein